MLSRMVCSDKPMDESRVTKCQQVDTLSARDSSVIRREKTRTNHVVRISSVVVSNIKEQP